MAQTDLSSLALILAAAARGTTRLSGGKGDGARQLATALTALGARLDDDGQGCWTVRGTGTGGWREPGRVLELGLVPGAAALLAGMLATLPFPCVLAADSGQAPLSLAALRAPLERVGARLVLGRGDQLPGSITGAAWPLPAHHAGLDGAAALPILLAGLNSPGRTGVDALPELEPALTLLRRFGAGVETADGVTWVTGYPDLTGTD
ncbi:MAG: 3-phosphoshikimate 1-carboxyvinyltransferase, partial [Niveispirillum sp.]|nr:3-phosphoshikimate 1-carboxyvinyltransferase [Niveispirillum sp.]